MSMQLLDIALFSHDGRRRLLSLRPGAVNLTKGQAFVARRCPAASANSSEDCFVDVGDLVEIPEAAVLRRTTNTEGLTALLTGWCGIRDNIHQPLPGQTRRALSASVRHALPLCFQSQNELTRKEQLFHVYDADPRQQGHKFQALQDTWPYFLGAVDDEYVRKLQEFARLRDELRSCERRLTEMSALRGDGLSKAAGLLAQARDAGLSVAVPQSWEDTIRALSIVAATPLASINVVLPDGAEFTRLADQRARLLDEQRRLRDEIAVARAFEQDEKGFSREATEQQARLKTIGIFDGSVPGENCPLCSKELQGTPPVPSVSEIRSTLSALSSRLESVARAAPQVETAIAEIEKKLQNVQHDLAQNRSEMEAVRTANDVLAQLQDDATKRAHILGRVSLYLESLPELPDTKALEEQAKRLRSQCVALDDELSDERIRERLESIVSILSQSTTAWARELDLEHSNSPLRLDVKKLTIVADTADGPVPMDQMGAGENWAGYHVVGHLALHEWFTKRGRPVPRFLFLDQPSQVGFPPEKDIEGSAGMVSGDERAKLVRMLKLIFRVVAELSPGMQVIITEHADLNED